ncbi:MAG: UrcA family protein [Pseudomonadota bacterium]
MRFNTIAAAIGLAAGTSLMAAAHAQTGPDTFAINIDLDTLQTIEGAEAFDSRLERSAHRYCHSSAPTASASSIEGCESRVISAVEAAVADAAAEEGTPIVWRSAGL